ncbi:Spy/CpxP family protein refolding chaperone [Gaoshiqia sediminis]|uniref:Periplasmic heavy metal sensor n=1 Tax=Gaoshiqia sediminis TaxID=2986998 RepID=A0AA41Y2B4_9BACT|nr:periplasmic heavy metal sensor [Gaoshiqia sediminis]MCW0482166.1 periplasmic heavy metal sensor [Gaoshiqia sediminis]
MFKSVKILTWLVVILFATNLATILSVAYHIRAEQQKAPVAPTTEVPGDQRTRFFREQLTLSEEQVLTFREANRAFNRKAQSITGRLDILRKRMVAELTSEAADPQQLAQLANEIGEEHERLKMATADFYLEVKTICDDTQKEKLAGIFRSLLDSDEKVNLPQRQFRHKNRP